MSNFIQFFKKGAINPTPLAQLDQEICDLLEVSSHPTYFGGDIFDWYNSIGYMLTTGLSLEDGTLKKHYQNSDIWKEEWPMISKIINYLKKKLYCKDLV